MYIVGVNGGYLPVSTIKGDDGSSAQMRINNGYLQWKNDDTEWANLIAMSELKGEDGDDGEDGKEVSLRVSGNILQWRLGDSGSWANLFDISAYSTVSIGTTTTGAAGTSASVTNSGTSTNAILNFTIPKGDKGDTGGGGGDMTKAIYDTNSMNTDVFEYVDVHVADTSNPHEVTAAQVGATPASHASDTNNPHSVTASQVGAAPLSHVSDTNNPHSVTAAQVGAATCVLTYIGAVTSTNPITFDLTSHKGLVACAVFNRSSGSFHPMDLRYIPKDIITYEITSVGDFNLHFSCVGEWEAAGAGVGITLTSTSATYARVYQSGTTFVRVDFWYYD